MRFRCAACQALTEVAIDRHAAAPVGVACGSCGRRYKVRQTPRKAAPDIERYRKARTFADANGIDLAAAYSVLEGIMTVADARGMAGAGAGTIKMNGVTAPLETGVAGVAGAAPGATPGIAAATPATESRSRPDEPMARQPTPVQFEPIEPYFPADSPASVIPLAPRAAPTPAPAVRAAARSVEEGPEFDDGFRTAVRDGCLTPQQAAERGDREALVHRLSQRHRLPRELATQVAENRITVHQALQRKAASEARDVPRPQTSISHGVWNFTVAALGLLILAGAGGRAWQEWQEYLTTKAEAAQRPALVLPVTPVAPAEPPQGGTHAAPSTPSLTLPITDAAGQIIMVTGPDPRSVLVAFCNTGHNAGRRQAFAIGPASPPSGTARVGLFRNLEQPNAPMRAIRIRRDTRSGRWMAGDGHQPIPTEPSPDLSSGARLIPVTAGADLPPAEQEAAPGPPPS